MILTPKRDPSSAAGGKPTVLVVDDDPQQLEMLELLLRRAGYEVQLAGGSIQALDMLQRTVPGAVVLDVMMPERSGIEVLERIRWNPRLAELPVIVLSALQLSKEELEFVGKFSVGFVEKTHVKDVLTHLYAIFQDKPAPPDAAK